LFNYEHVLGTSLELQVRARSERTARWAECEVLEEIDRLERILSGWSPESEFSRWLQTRGESVRVSAELIAILSKADQWRTITGRAFDPAAQEVIEQLIQKGIVPPPAFEEKHTPLWTVNSAASTACLLTEASISLDAIAKGYIVAQAAARGAAIDGVEDVLLNVGGDIQHYGSHATVAGVADPFAPEENGPAIGAVRIQNAALATSGGYRRGFVTSGRRVSHIVDPRTGLPVDHIASASVFAPDCATADALATAFSVMQPAQSVALADALSNVGCMLVEKDGAITTSSAWMDRAVYTNQLQVA
jgi:thiamine biosynthesis lipoprotein